MRLICWRLVLREKDPLVCGECKEKCVQEEKENRLKFSEIFLDSGKPKR
jgi:hypothetical protein